MNSDAYEKAWVTLTRQLDLLEHTGGSLVPVVVELERQQKETGFIRDELYDIERLDFSNAGHQLLAQLNPRRAQRFSKPNNTPLPEHETAINDGCVLCRDNIRWQQQGKEFGYPVPGMARSFILWMNPFPLLPSHVTVTSASHESQEWEFHPDGTLPLEHLLTDFVSLGQRLPGFVGFYNGVNAGASIPAHCHYQFGRRPAGIDHFPLERAPRDFDAFTTTGVINDYPLEVAVWQGHAEFVIKTAGNWINTWSDRNRDNLPNLSANLVVTCAPNTGELTLYFAPRDRQHRRSQYLAGTPGGLEVLGEIVLSSETERQAFENGTIDFNTLIRIYDDIRTPLFPD